MIKGYESKRHMSRFAKRRDTAYYKIWYFWTTYGTKLQTENGYGTFKYEFVDKMYQLYQDIADAKNNVIIHGKIIDILGEQRQYLIQFECCLDAFNDYMCALRLLDVMFRHNMC
jgi:CTP-dependent riboflavin kinase